MLKGVGIMLISNLRANWPEKAGFVLNRPYGRKDYTFLHFITEIDILADGKIITAPAGTSVFFAPDFPQYFSSDKGFSHDWFHGGTGLKELLDRYKIKENKLYFPKNDKIITNAMYKLESEFSANKQYKDELLNCELNSFLIHFSRLVNENEEEPLSRADLNILRKVRNTVFSSLNRKWTVAEMADAANMSEPRFFAKYKNLFGTSPNNDLIEARINFAKNRLLYTDMSILDISIETGYSNEYHFIRQFKNRTGLSPTNFKNINKSF